MTAPAPLSFTEAAVEHATYRAAIASTVQDVTRPGDSVLTVCVALSRAGFLAATIRQHLGDIEVAMLRSYRR